MREPRKFLPPVIIPNTATNILLVSFWDAGEGKPPHYQHHSIIAWKLEASVDDELIYNDPIIADEMENDPSYCLEERIGDSTAWYIPGFAAFATFDEARSYMANKFNLRRNSKKDTTKESAN